MIKGIHHISMKCGSAEELIRVKDFYIGVLLWPFGGTD